MAWAAILVYVAWPLHERALARVGGRRIWAALTAFGLIGLFVGPVILAILLARWREWAAATDASTRPPPA